MSQIMKKQDTRAGRGGKILSKVNQSITRKPPFAEGHTPFFFFFFLVESKVCFILDAGNWREVQTRVQRPTHPPDNQRARAFIGKERVLHAETAQAALTVIEKLVIGGLTSTILIVLGTVNLQFPGRFVPISLRPILGIVAAYVMATAWSSCS